MEFVNLGPNAIDISGRSFGRWAALGPTRRMKFSNGGEHVFWLCRCSCGIEKEVNGQSLRRGLSLSCGCLQRESASKRGKANTRHGMKKTSEWQAWCSLRYRCLDKKHKQYPDYGGRGITVCSRWMVFENFLADMGPRPGKGYSIDRKNNNGNYEPDNCRWATSKEQNRNTRLALMVTAFGETRKFSDFMPYDSDHNIYTRTYSRIKRGWPHEKAILAGLLGR